MDKTYKSPLPTKIVEAGLRTPIHTKFHMHTNKLSSTLIPQYILLNFLDNFHLIAILLSKCMNKRKIAAIQLRINTFFYFCPVGISNMIWICDGYRYSIFIAWLTMKFLPHWQRKNVCNRCSETGTNPAVVQSQESFFLNNELKTYLNNITVEGGVEFVERTISIYITSYHRYLDNQQRCDVISPLSACYLTHNLKME